MSSDRRHQVLERPGRERHGCGEAARVACHSLRTVGVVLGIQEDEEAVTEVAAVQDTASEQVVPPDLLERLTEQGFPRVCPEAAHPASDLVIQVAVIGRHALQILVVLDLDAGEAATPYLPIVFEVDIERRPVPRVARVAAAGRVLEGHSGHPPDSAAGHLRHHGRAGVEVPLQLPKQVEAERLAGEQIPEQAITLDQPAPLP